VLSDELEAFADQAVDFQEFGWYQDCDSIFVVKLRSTILLDGGYFVFIVSVIVTFLNF